MKMNKADAPNEVPTKEAKLYHLVFFQGGKDLIHRGTIISIQEQLDDIVITPPDETEIDIWIESPGGSAHAAYKLILDLRSRCRRLRAIIPDYAKSAATLLTLGVEQIFMAPAAELGPLDVQLEHPDRENVIVSGLDVAGSLEFLAKTAINLSISGGASVVKYTGLPRQGVLHMTFEFMAQLIQPTVAKIDPHLLHQASQQLKIAERYAMSMLKTRRLQKDEHMDANAAKLLMRLLISGYPAHEFVIGRDDAREIGLPVLDAEQHPRWKQIKKTYNAFINSKNGDSLICVIKDSSLDKSKTTNDTQESDYEESMQQSNNGADSGTEDSRAGALSARS